MPTSPTEQQSVHVDCDYEDSLYENMFCVILLYCKKCYFDGMRTEICTCFTFLDAEIISHKTE